MTPKENAKPSARRIAIVERNSTETRIAIKLTIEGSGKYKIATAFASSITCWSCSRATAHSILN